MIIEEFGVTTASQTSTYTTWLNQVISSGLAGDLIWFVAPLGGVGVLCGCGTNLALVSSGKQAHTCPLGTLRTTDTQSSPTIQCTRSSPHTPLRSSRVDDGYLLLIDVFRLYTGLGSHVVSRSIYLSGVLSKSLH